MTVDSYRYSAYDSTAIQPNVSVCPEIQDQPYCGWISLLDVFVVNGTYFREVETGLLELEAMVQPIVVRDEAASLAAIAPSGLTAIAGPIELGQIDPLKGLPVPLPEIVSTPKQSMTDYLIMRADTLEVGARVLKFKRMASRAGHLKEYVIKNRGLIDKWRDHGIVSEIKFLRETFNDDLEEQKIFIPDQAKAGRYNQKFPFGETVFNAFEDARRDVKGAVNCYATDNDTACVVHCMRAAEYGLRGLARRLLGKKNFAKLEWGPIVKDLRNRIDKLNQPTRSKRVQPNREARLEFYREALDKCTYFKKMRDDAMHTRGHYEEPEASRALTNVQELLELLAKNGIVLHAAIP